jgi:hypothetical protein
MSLTFIILGSPPAWTPPAADAQLRPDSGDVFRDINAARYSTFPTEPAVRSIFAFRPEYDLSAVDVMACGSTMGNLLRFARNISKPFRFDVDVVGDTVFFVRRENSPTELIEDVRGYGHAFPEAYTTWDKEVRDSCSHQRIIEYDFGGLHFLIRSETDGYLREPSTSQAKEKNSSSLEDILSSMAVASAVPSSDQKLALKMQGAEVPQDQIFDIKTRSNFKVFDMEEILPRLWVNQTRNFLLAYHQYGRFDRPQVADVEKNILTWQKDNSAALGRFHAIIKRIVDLVRDPDGRQAEVSWDGEGPLKVTKQIGIARRVLPFDLLQTWAID